MKSTFPSFVLLILTGLVSCSVKEDRIECPTKLSVDLSGCIGSGDICISAWNGFLLFRDWHISRNNIYQYDIPRGNTIFSAFSGSPSDILHNDILIIPKGTQCDSIYAMGTKISTSEDNCLIEVKLHKQFATVILEISENSDTSSEVKFIVKGNVNGLDIKTMKPNQGEFEVVAEKIGDGFYYVRVPRQIDDSLVLELWIDESLYDIVEIGKKLQKEGYDWMAEDLEDINFKLDVHNTNLEVVIQDWSGEVLPIINIQ